MRDELLEYFAAQWPALRAMTLDLLESIPETQLQDSPSPSVGPWWKQFRHMGRVQENYLQAIGSGRIAFGIEQGSYHGGISKKSLRDYLSQLDIQLTAVLDRPSPSLRIDWFGEQKSLAQHLLCLAEHEILHHGQWIVYQKQLARNFPPSWSVWGMDCP